MAGPDEEWYVEPSSWNFVITPVSIISFIIALILPKLLSPLACGIFQPRTKNIPPKLQTHFHTLISSTIHAIVVTVIDVYLILSGSLGTNYIFSKNSLGFASLQFSLGYFVGDFIVCFMDPYLRSDMGSISHHVTGLLSISFSLANQGIFMYLITFRTIAELSTPFVNLRWYHYQLGNKDNFWYKFASLSMMALFFLSRIATLPYNWYALIVTLMDPQCAVIVKIYYRVWIVSGYLVLDFLNLYWFSKMLKGARKFFSQKKDS
ncbi:TLC domain-containing protein 4-B-like [Halichondria panicea]|uniref:TLC domain-containing protein 4-B-like n=1 Tax=Halichondria panicea TaxID=6063 RepID=UPI00312B7527